MKRNQSDIKVWYVGEWLCVVILCLFGSSIIIGLAQWQNGDGLGLLRLTLFVYLGFAGLNLLGYVLKHVAESTPIAYH
ncbi:hypothetical protein KJ848_03570 [Patescibacteria group bacterium]|nr:hypothetical protein [Patescibacteria group bacterium]MBU2159233.1 hypothetical protein [Patescibacteria group bacterium]